MSFYCHCCRVFCLEVPVDTIRYGMRRVGGGKVAVKVVHVSDLSGK
jgi:hypothetical protein